MGATIVNFSAQTTIRLSLAINSPAQQRDIEVNSRDSFRIIVDLYEDEDDSTIDPLQLVNSSMTFEQLGYPNSQAIAVDNTFTFDQGTPRYSRPRVPYRIVLSDLDGLRVTLCFGFIVTRDAKCGPFGLLGNDYGWWPQ